MMANHNSKVENIPYSRVIVAQPSLCRNCSGAGPSRPILLRFVCILVVEVYEIIVYRFAEERTRNKRVVASGSAEATRPLDASSPDEKSARALGSASRWNGMTQVVARVSPFSFFALCPLPSTSLPTMRPPPFALDVLPASAHMIAGADQCRGVLNTQKDQVCRS
jgi:hypothetical protein